MPEQPKPHWGKNILMLLFVTCLPCLTTAQGWENVGGTTNGLEANGAINSVRTDQTGNIYAAGNFTDTGGRSYVAKWNGSSWTELGAGPDRLNANGHIFCLATDNLGNVYASGNFTDSAATPSSGHCYVAKWNGTTWTELGTGTHALNANNAILSIITDASGNVYAAGDFTDTNSREYVAKWDGSTWTELGTGPNALNANWSILSICMDPAGNIYAAGIFSDSSMYYIGHHYVAKWDGSAWAELGTGSNALNADAWIYTLTTDAAGNVYAAGMFSDANGKKYVAKWNGSSWTELGTGANALNAISTIYTITSDNAGNIYAAAWFKDTGIYDYIAVAKWNGSSWAELGTGTNALNANGSILTVTLDALNNIYAAGNFTDVNGKWYVAEYGHADEGTPTIRPLENKINIFPNPANDEVNIIAKGTLQIYDLAGREIYTAELKNTNNTVDVSDWCNGIYICTVHYGNTKNSVKMVVEH